MPRSDFSFSYPLRVRWAEADMQGIVFNGNYLSYFDVAFTEYWRATGLPNSVEQAKTGIELFARKSTIEYLSPARFDDILDIGLRCSGFGRSSMRFLLEIHRAEQHLISGELIYVYANIAERTSVTVPEHWRQAITQLEKIPPTTL